MPNAPLLGDPLLCSVFELNNTSTQLTALSKLVYLASEANYNTTGQYVAYGEGNNPSGQYVYEWVVGAGGTPWQITTSGGGSFSGNPIIYTKIAFSFLALYNTTYAINMVVYLKQCLPDPTGAGYFDGADNYSNMVADLGSNTNSLILDAAQYAIQNNSTS